MSARVAVRHSRPPARRRCTRCGQVFVSQTAGVCLDCLTGRPGGGPSTPPERGVVDPCGACELAPASVDVLLLADGHLVALCCSCADDLAQLGPAAPAHVVTMRLGRGAA